MNVTREVILDLIPIYLANEASPATRALIDERLAEVAIWFGHYLHCTVAF
jgi:hypothetical protein